MIFTLRPVIEIEAESSNEALKKLLCNMSNHLGEFDVTIDPDDGTLPEEEDYPSIETKHG